MQTFIAFIENTEKATLLIDTQNNFLEDTELQIPKKFFEIDM